MGEITLYCKIVLVASSAIGGGWQTELWPPPRRTSLRWSGAAAREQAAQRPFAGAERKPIKTVVLEGSSGRGVPFLDPKIPLLTPNRV
jgi:hypothetical protein